MLFRFEAFYVEERNVTKVLSALRGMAIDLKPPSPVENAVMTDGKMEAKSSGSMLDVFTLWLKGRAGFSKKEVRAFMVQNGRAEGSANDLLVRARAAGIIRNGKKVGEYLTKGGVK